MYWKDEGYLLFKTNFDENSIIIETFTLNHGKYSGVVYGGSSRKKKKSKRGVKTGRGIGETSLSGCHTLQLRFFIFQSGFASCLRR